MVDITMFFLYLDKIYEHWSLSTSNDIEKCPDKWLEALLKEKFLLDCDSSDYANSCIEYLYFCLKNKQMDSVMVIAVFTILRSLNGDIVLFKHVKKYRILLLDIRKNSPQTRLGRTIKHEIDYLIKLNK